MRIAAMTAAWMLPCPPVQFAIIAWAFCRIFAASARWADSTFPN